MDGGREGVSATCRGLSLPAAWDQRGRDVGVSVWLLHAVEGGIRKVIAGVIVDGEEEMKGYWGRKWEGRGGMQPRPSGSSACSSNSGSRVVVWGYG